MSSRRDNFGPRVAQIAAVALIIDYIVTVAVQTSAGTDALTSAFPALAADHGTVLITVGVVLLLTYGNLRGISEAGRTFALPTYLFVAAVGSLVVVGLVRWALGELHPHSHPPSRRRPHRDRRAAGCSSGPASSSSCGPSPTAARRSPASRPISNGVANFREPTGRTPAASLSSCRRPSARSSSASRSSPASPTPCRT